MPLALWVQSALLLGHCNTAQAIAPPIAAHPTIEHLSIETLTEKGVYWYERFRFDLARQSFNRILLIDPLNASALRWQGLIDLARGDVDASRIWLNKLVSVHGKQHPHSLELLQTIELNSTKRQRFAELRYLSSSPNVPANITTQLNNLFEYVPQGEAAVQVYRIMARTPEGRALARLRLQTLITQNPSDKRYQALQTDIGTATQSNVQVVRVSSTNTRPTFKKAKPKQPIKTNRPATPEVVELAIPSQQAQTEPELSNFEQGQALSQQAQTELNAKNYTQAIALLEHAIALNPDYPWLRFDLANAWMDSGLEHAQHHAQTTMDEGLSLNNGVEMRFASALLATRQDRTDEALALLEGVPRTEWTDGMTALEKRINYGQYLTTLRTLNDQEHYNALGQSVYAPNNPWAKEPEVLAYQEQLSQRKQIRVRTAYENANIDGTAGVSRAEVREIPVQLDIPTDYEKTVFLRLDTLRAHAGRVDVTDTTNFAQLGTTTATDPAIQASRLNQNYQGHVVGMGIETNTLRLDLGTTLGNLPVNSWVGGAQWKIPVGEGSLKLELARRMVTGSVLSTTGAIDPLTGQAWGGARRNGLSAVYYTPLTPTVDFVGIAKVNRITGKHIPSNTEYNLQGILSKTLYQRPGQRVEIGASLFLWSFDKNLRFYTYGQGGYYSPQAFGSFTVPITWTANTARWAWRLQAKIGASESHNDPTNLYPLDTQLAQSAEALGNATQNQGGRGGGTSTGLRANVEHQLQKDWVVGGFLELDRSEGYNPNRMQMYLKYSFGPSFDLSTPPETVTPYSRF